MGGHLKSNNGVWDMDVCLDVVFDVNWVDEGLIFKP